ncbi:MAG: ATP-binding protein [Sulfolobales archaeon]
MLFDPRPKIRREDLFDREREVEELKEAVSRYSLTLLLGIRRIGKTSVLRVALNELGAPYIYLDLRALEGEGYNRASLYRLFSESFTDVTSKWRGIADYLRGIKGIEVRAFGAGFRVDLDWSERSLTLGGILSELNRAAERVSPRRFIVIAFDEAQILRYMSGGKGRIDFREILAYAYDNLPNLRFILTGSEVGLLLGMLRLDDPRTPLYGRFVKMIKLERFDMEKSLEFLRRGFDEAGVRVGEDIIQRIYERVDGIVGWLTYFGSSIIELRYRGSNSEIVEEIAEKALKLIEKELGEILKRSKYHVYILKAIALGINTWSGIKRAVEAWLGRPVENTQIARSLKTLAELSIIEKRNQSYLIADPLIAEYCRRKL